MRRYPIDSPDVDPQTVDAWRRHIGGKVDPEAIRVRLAEGTLPEAFSAAAQRNSHRPALTINHHTVSHGVLDHLAGKAATQLAELAVDPGDRVLLMADVGLEEIVAYLGGLRLGAIIVLANPMLTSAEVGQLALESEASLLLGSGSSLMEASKIRPGDIREIVGLRPSDKDQSSVQLHRSDVDSAPAQPVDPEATAILAFTSGTTGRSKPTPLSHRNLLASIRGAMWAWRWNADDHLVHSLPISHQHGLSGIHATLLAGSQATLLGRLDAERTFRAVKYEGASLHFGVAAIHQRLLDALGERAAGLSSLRLAISGSGPLPIELFERYLSVTGTELLERYGTTESGLDVSNLCEGPRLPGHVGLPLPGVEVAVAEDEDSSSSVMVGEVLIRGPQVFSGYLGVSESEQPFLADWFRTGDIGEVDRESGFLRIVGRSKQVIISGGMNVYPREVEDAIRAFPGVEDVAVTGTASDRWGEEVVAVVAPAGLDEDGLSEFVATRLAGYKRPKTIVTVNEIPRNAVGKVIGSQLSGLIASGDAALLSDGIGSSDSRSE